MNLVAVEQQNGVWAELPNHALAAVHVLGLLNSELANTRT